MQALVFSNRLAGSSAARLSLIGKWSMTDVFVASMTLVVFAFNTNAASDASAGVGLYYFAGYCLTSLLASVLLERQAKYEQRPLNA
jgi:uncharacterized paraquat-inducible protein A